MDRTTICGKPDDGRWSTPEKSLFHNLKYKGIQTVTLIMIYHCHNLSLFIVLSIVLFGLWIHCYRLLISFSYIYKCAYLFGRHNFLLFSVLSGFFWHQQGVYKRMLNTNQLNLCFSVAVDVEALANTNKNRNRANLYINLPVKETFHPYSLFNIFLIFPSKWFIRFCVDKFNEVLRQLKLFLYSVTNRKIQTVKRLHPTFLYIFLPSI